MLGDELGNHTAPYLNPPLNTCNPTATVILILALYWYLWLSHEAKKHPGRNPAINTIERALIPDEEVLKYAADMSVMGAKVNQYNEFIKVHAE